MNIKFPSSVRLNLLLVVLAGILPMAVVVFLSGLERRQQEIGNAFRATSVLAEFFALQQENEAQRIKAVLERLAQEQEVRALDVPACTAVLRNYLAANPNYVNFALLSETGDALASALPFSSQNLLDRKEFADARQSGRLSVGEYSVGRVSGVQVLPFAQPVQDEAGRLLGVLIATLRLQDLAPAFEQATLPPDSFVGLADGRGVRLYRHPERPTNPLGSRIILNVWERIRGVDRSASFTDTASDGSRQVFAVRRVALAPGDEPYLNIFVGIPESTLIARADTVTWDYVRWLGVSLLLSCVLAWVVAKYGIHERVAWLVQVAGRLGAGDLSARSGLTDRRGILGRLAGSLDDMASALERDAAERLRSREALEAEMLRRKALMDQSSDGIAVVDERLVVVEANLSCAAMLGYTLDEMLGRPLRQFEAAMSGEDLRRKFDDLLSERSVYDSVFRRKDGSLLDVEVSASGTTVLGEPLMLAVIRDVSQRKQAEAALRESEERYALAVRGTNDGIWDMDLRGGRVYLSARWKEIVGFAPEETPDFQTWLKRIHPEDRERLIRAHEDCSRGTIQSFEVEYRLLHPDGSIRWALGRGASLRDAEGRVIRMAGSTADITERRRMMELMLQTEKMMSVGGLAAGMAHEINNPLGGIIQSTQVLKGRLGKDTPANRAAAQEEGCRLESVHGFCERRQVYALLGSVGEAAVRASRIVQDMLAFCRQGAELAPGDVGGVLDKALALCASDYDLKKSYDFRHIVITRDYQDNLPPVACVEGQLAQVFMNILRNAAQAMNGAQPGGRRPGIVLRTRSEPGVVRVEIEDNGPGMDEATRRKAFEPFFTTKPPGVGTGLGLSVSYFIITTNHGGTLEVQSSPGEGARFVIRLPVAEGLQRA